MPERRKSPKLILLFVILFLLLSYPIMKLVNLPERIAGVPLLYAYVFGVWIIAIAALAFTVEFTLKPSSKPDPHE
jgi:hypothetical protein